MKLRLSQLSTHVQQSLAPLYLIASNEPVLIQEAVKLIRAAASQQQFNDYQWTSPSSTEDWEKLLSTQQTLDLFSQKQIIEIFLPTGKTGQTGAKYLQRLVKNLHGEQILIITADKIDKTLLSSRWVTLCEQAGVLVPIWPFNANELAQWLQSKASAQGIQLSAAVQKELLLRTRGNLTATFQALHQLSVYPQPIEMQQLKEIIAQQAQHAINDYIQLLFARNYIKSLQILQHLQTQAVEPTWIIWQLAQHVRIQLNTSVNPQPVWKTALHLIYELDAIAKGNSLAVLPWNDIWAALRHFTLKIGQASK